MMTLKEAAQQVLQLVAQGSYEVDGATVSFADAQASAVNGTTLYTPERLSDLRAPPQPARRYQLSMARHRLLQSR